MCCRWPIESADGLVQTRRMNSFHPCVVEMQGVSYLRDRLYCDRLYCWSNLLAISVDPGVPPTKEEHVVREL